LVINVNFDEEFITEEFKRQEENEEKEEEEVENILKPERATHNQVQAIFQERCPSAVVNIDYSSMNVSEDNPDLAIKDMCALALAKMMPKAHVLVIPNGEIDFGGLVTKSICTSATKQKFTVIDTLDIFERGGHSPEIEAQLHKASFTAEAPDCVPAKLWVDLFQEAFAASANPTGPFLITNFPTPSSVTGMGPTVRDQFCMLEGIVVLEGILQVRLSEEAFALCCPDRSLSFEMQQDFDNKVNSQILTQYDKNRICEAAVESIPDGREVEAAEKVCGDFLSFLETQQ